MTWTKLGDEFSDDCARAALTDAEFRLHVEAILWANRRESGPQITARDVRRFAETADPETAIAGLVAAGFWTDLGDGCWEIVHAMGDQIEPPVLDARRKAARERQRRWRYHHVGDHSLCRPGSRCLQNEPQDEDMSRRYMTRYPGRVGSGQEVLTTTQREEQTYARTHAHDAQAGAHTRGHAREAGQGEP